MHRLLAKQIDELHVAFYHVVDQPLAQELRDDGALFHDGFQPFRGIPQGETDPLDQCVEFHQKAAVLELVLIEMQVAAGNLDAFLSLEMSLRIPPQLAQRELDVAGILGESQNKLDCIDQQDEVAMVVIDVVVTDAELGTPEYGHKGFVSSSAALALDDHTPGPGGGKLPSIVLPGVAAQTPFTRRIPSGSG